HDVALRKIAISKGLHLNEWGVYDDNNNRLIASSKEEEVYDILGLRVDSPRDEGKQRGNRSCKKRKNKRWSNKIARSCRYTVATPCKVIYRYTVAILTE
ncbi:MAG: hypothetical protein M3146_08000, partial [Thermoproteota archaeon]|nr:hypothetical protein [Thermoproteota archaeon]